MLHLWIVLQLAGASEVFADVPTDPRLDRLQAWAIDGPAAGTFRMDGSSAH